MVCLHGFGGKCPIPRKGGVSSWTRTPVLFLFHWRQEKTSHCSLVLPPAQQASLHQPQARGVSSSDSHRIRVSALSLPTPSCPALPWLPRSAPAPSPLPLSPTS